MKNNISDFIEKYMGKKISEPERQVLMKLVILDLSLKWNIHPAYKQRSYGKSLAEKISKEIK